MRCSSGAEASTKPTADESSEALHGLHFTIPFQPIVMSNKKPGKDAAKKPPKRCLTSKTLRGSGLTGPRSFSMASGAARMEGPLAGMRPRTAPATPRRCAVLPKPDPRTGGFGKNGEAACGSWGEENVAASGVQPIDGVGTSIAVSRTRASLSSARERGGASETYAKGDGQDARFLPPWASSGDLCEEGPGSAEIRRTSRLSDRLAQSRRDSARIAKGASASNTSNPNSNYDNDQRPYSTNSNSAQEGKPTPMARNKPNSSSKPSPSPYGNAPYSGVPTKYDPANPSVGSLRVQSPEPSSKAIYGIATVPERMQRAGAPLRPSNYGFRPNTAP